MSHKEFSSREATKNSTARGSFFGDALRIWLSSDSLGDLGWLRGQSLVASRFPNRTKASDVNLAAKRTRLSTELQTLSN